MDSVGDVHPSDPKDQPYFPSWLAPGSADRNAKTVMGNKYLSIYCTSMARYKKNQDA